MADGIGYEEFAAMVRAAAEKVRANVERLSKLDSVGGDGDHGTTMARAMGKAEAAIEAESTGQLKSLLLDIGWGIMGVDGGATGPLLGTLFMGMADAVGEAESLDASALADAFAAGLAALEKQTRARPGDKTLMDALVPAVTALRDTATAGGSPADALQAAAEAAEGGAEATKELQARFGRARNIKEASVGSPDPGATSMALLFRGFAGACA
jgi:dihydroxyacetone kinase-like protein